jgi:hypothetical protein
MALASGVGGSKKVATKTATSTKVASDPAGARFRAMEAAAKKAAEVRGITKDQLLQQMQKGPLKPYVAPKSVIAAKPKESNVIATDEVTPPVGINRPVYTEPVLPDAVPELEATPWSLENDPVYQAAMASGSSSFNFARNAALAAKQNAETGAAQNRRDLDTNAAENRRRLAGNYAARGMAGGAAGALTMAEAQANARQVADRTSISDQISALNQDYLANYGATGSDWTGTLMGQQYKTQAAQAAIQAQLARYGVA